MMLQEFVDIFAVLALQTHASDVDQATIEAYYPVLSDIPVEIVKEAAQRLARQVNSDGQSWFPKAAEWRVMAARVEAQWKDDQRAILRRLKEPLCKRCHDTQWKRMSNGRVKPCECRELRQQELLGRRPLPRALVGGKDISE